jgi:predicted RNase H-like HicB family nuclease
MRYPVALVRTEEGYSVSCPGLPGCWSQGATEEEALPNIQDGIREYLSVAKQLASPQNLREVQIPAQRTPRDPGSLTCAPSVRSKKPGFRSSGEASIVMTDGSRTLTIPRYTPVDALTMGGIVHDAGLTPQQFRKLLREHAHPRLSPFHVKRNHASMTP